MTKLSADWSRRTFLRGALVTGALVLPASAVLAGCSGGQETTQAEVNPLGASTSAPGEVYLLSGGFGSIWISSAHMARQPLRK